jgi:hypothetical protein
MRPDPGLDLTHNSDILNSESGILGGIKRAEVGRGVLSRFGLGGKHVSGT